MTDKIDITYQDVRNMNVNELLRALVELKVNYAMNDPFIARELLREHFTRMLVREIGKLDDDKRLGLINELYDSGYWS